MEKPAVRGGNSKQIQVTGAGVTVPGKSGKDLQEAMAPKGPKEVRALGKEPERPALFNFPAGGAAGVVPADSGNQKRRGSMYRNQFTFYVSFAQAIARIKKKADRADAYDAICNYALYGQEPDLDTMADAAAIAFVVAKPNLDASRRKAESGKRGGQARDHREPEQEAASRQASGASKEKEATSKGQAKSKQGVQAKEEPMSGEKEKKKETETEKESENECSRDAFRQFAAEREELYEALQAFGEMRRKIRKPLTGRAEALLLEKLKSLASGPEEQIAILNQSTIHCWQDLYPLRSGTEGPGTSRWEKPIQRVQHHDDELSPLEKEAVQRLLRKGETRKG